VIGGSKWISDDVMWPEVQVEMEGGQDVRESIRRSANASRSIVINRYDNDQPRR
jgi:hypothetical protein